MSLRPVERTGSARVAVVGAETSIGGQVRQALADRRVPGGRVDLYGRTGDEVVLSEYAGEARLIQHPDPDEVVEHEIVFLCETGDAARRVLAAAGNAVVIDLAGAGEPALPLVHPDADGAKLPAAGARVAVPHPLALVLGDLLEPLHDRYGVERAMACLFRPAADFGEAGIEELRDQTVRLLNFLDLPREVFGAQLAFNVIPQGVLRASEPGLEARLSAEVGQRLGWGEPRLGLKLITVPVFHGHAVSLHVWPRTPAEASEALEAFSEAGLVDLPREGSPHTPLEAAGNRRTVVAELSPDGAGGLWIWAVAGEAAAAAADHAVRLADRVAAL